MSNLLATLGLLCILTALAFLVHWPYVLGVFGALLIGVSWVTHRNDEAEKARARA